MVAQFSADAASRQAFGMFDRTPADESLAARILSGSLVLHPHPAWQLPEEIDWSADPFEDRNWRAQLHMLRWMDPLRRQAEDGDADAAALWLRHAQSWIEHHPSERPEGEAWMDMVDGIRAIELCLAVPFVERHEPTALEWLIPSIAEHMRWLADEQHLGHSNHALHQHQGLFVCAAVLQDEAMMRLAEARLDALFETQYDDQGVNAEGAIAYHLANYAWWSVARRRLEVAGRPVPPSVRALEQAPIALAHATKPDGSLVSIGDTDGGSARTIDHPVTRWVTTAGADGTPPDELVRLYDAGYVFARSGWGEHERAFNEETFWSLSFGPGNRVHGHADGLSMTFSSMGHEWITDPGKFQYGTSDMRDYCLRRESHSLPYLRGRAYDKRSVVRCVRKFESQATYDFTFEDRGYEGAVISRRVIYSVSGEYVVVIDAVASEQECTAVQRWQCGAGIEAEPQARGFSLAAGEARAAVLFSGTRPSMESVVGQDDPIDGWVATGWKQRAAAPSLSFSKSGTRFRFITVLAAGFRGSEPTLETVRDAQKGELRLRVDTGRVAEQIVITRDGSRVVPFAEDPSIEVAEAPADDTGAMLDPCDAETRREVFSAIERARAVGRAGPDARRAAAAELSELRRRFSMASEVDLGMGAALSDLLERSASEAAESRHGRARQGLVAWAGSPLRRLDGPADVSMIGGVSVEDRLPSLSATTLIAYEVGTLVLPVMIAPADGDTLTVLFHGAVDRARTRLPFFQRLRFQQSLAAGPTLAFSDPTLDLSHELRLAWYLGTEHVDMAGAIGTAIESIAHQLGTPKIVLQGGSGGGFAALQVGALVPGSHVVAMSPQTDLRRYSARFYRSAMDVAFGGAGLAEARYLPRIDAMRRIEETGTRMDVTLVMNSGDLFHEREHATPLRQFFALRGRDELRERVFDLGPGHVGLDNTQYEQVMDEVYERLATVRGRND